MAGVKAKKGKKLMAKAAKTSSRTVKGKNKVAKVPRQDKKKGAAVRARRKATTTKSQSD